MLEFNSKRSLYLNDDINPRSSLELISGLSTLHSADPTTPITLFITSRGGNVSDAFATYEYVTKLLKPNLQTVVFGEASSTAIIMFLMGNRRFIGRIAIMKFHRFSFTIEKGIVLTAKQAEKIRLNLENSEGKYVDIIADKSDGKLTRDEVKALLDNEVTITAFHAIKLGLAHKVL